MAKKSQRSSRPIVVGHLEKVSSGVFEGYQKEVTGLVKQGQGVYALYRRHKLYYIGLASDLEKRIKWHLKDKHKGKWDRFSLYMIKKTDHIREVESILVRIAEPGGNKLRGRLRGSKNLERDLETAIKHRQDEEREKIFSKRKRKIRLKKGKKRIRKTRAEKRPLKGFFKSGKVLYGRYKGKDYKLWVNRIGRIRFNGKLYDSPSGAAKAIVDKGAVDGWNFWKYKNKSGNLIAIKHLRK